jgi:hypothetical protein
MEENPRTHVEKLATQFITSFRVTRDDPMNYNNMNNRSNEALHRVDESAGGDGVPGSSGSGFAAKIGGRSWAVVRNPEVRDLFKRFNKTSDAVALSKKELTMMLNQIRDRCVLKMRPKDARKEIIINICSPWNDHRNGKSGGKEVSFGLQRGRKDATVTMAEMNRLVHQSSDTDPVQCVREMKCEFEVL